MLMQKHHNQATSPSDTTAWLQSLLTTPITPHPQHHSYADLPLDSDTTALLQTLLTTPVPADYLFRPVKLLSLDNLRGMIMQGRQRRDRFDALLASAEGALLLISVLALGTWGALGPIGNWLHKQQTATVLPVSARQGTAPLIAPVRQVIPTSLPMDLSVPRLVDDPKSSKLATLPQEDFLAPSQMFDVAHSVDLPPQPNHLLIPSIKVDTSVIEVFFVDSAWQVAQYAAGYLHATGLPGDPGNVVLAGHAGFFGGVFANLGALEAGDDIYIDAAGWRYQYRVRKSLVVWPTQSEFMRPTDIPTMTLITCTNWDLQRLVVIADLVGSRPL
jgi:sortase A